MAARAIGIMLGLELTRHPFRSRPSYMAIADLPLDERARIMADPAVKARIENAFAVHDLEYSRRRAGADKEMTAEERAAVPPVRHPLVRRHPVTGRKSLYVGHHCVSIEGVDDNGALLAVYADAWRAAGHRPGRGIRERFDRDDVFREGRVIRNGDRFDLRHFRRAEAGSQEDLST